ncbi:MAG: aspartate aminotransferase family protein [bacterium]
MEMQKRFVLGTYTPDLTLVRGSMAHVWDDQGNRYLDFGTGISVCNLGHCHPRVTEAIQRQAGTLVHVSNLYYNENQPRLAARIAEHSFGGKVFFANSGAEANEGMIKFARRWGNPQGRHEIVTMQDSFHGRTLATLAATGRAKYRAGFQPDMEGFAHVPFNDIDALEAAIGDQTAAVLLEPVQGEGGVIAADRDYLTAVQELCRERGILLLLDEVQCGMGRTGEYFAYQHYGLTPDAMSLAKSLGNGVPIGAFEVRADLDEVLPPGTHASTFGGNPLACAAGVAVFDALEQENVLENAVKIAAQLRAGLAGMQQRYEFIRELRGLGLMIGLQMNVPVKTVMAEARKQGLLVLTAGEDVLRLMPPLTLSPSEADTALEILDEVFGKL